MTIETLNEFVRQNGAFGVLILLVFGFCWWGVPYLAKRLEDIQAKSDARAESAQSRHEVQLNGLVKSHQDQLSSIVTRFDDQLSNVVAGHRESMKENTQALQSITTEVKNMNERLVDVELKIAR